MKHIQVFEDFTPESIQMNEAKDYADINDISEVFETFVKSVEELGKKKAFKYGIMEPVIEALNEAWEELCIEHGVDFEPIEINF